MLLIGTRKGAFLAFSDRDRRRWTLKGPIFKGVQVNDVVHVADGGSAGSIIVAGKSEWWGPGVQVSSDLGESWEERPPVRFAEGRGLSAERVWIVRKGRLGDGTPALFAGVDPAALFASTDGGSSWREIEALTNHDSRSIWSPGAGEFVHTHISAVAWSVIRFERRRLHERDAGMATRVGEGLQGSRPGERLPGGTRRPPRTRDTPSPSRSRSVAELPRTGLPSTMGHLRSHVSARRATCYH